jgi:hypothetical protein
MNAKPGSSLFKLSKNRAKFNITIQENAEMNKFQLVIINMRITDQKYLTIFVKECAIIRLVLHYFGVILGERKS